jgi:hypothetical protein
VCSSYLSYSAVSSIAFTPSPHRFITFICDQSCDYRMARADNRGAPAPNSFKSTTNATSNNGKKRVWIDTSDEESFLPNGVKMNGHSTPSARKKSRSSTSTAPRNGLNRTLARTKELQSQRRALPIYTGISSVVLSKPYNHFELNLGKEKLVKHVMDHDVTVLIGETGSGKTTRMWSTPIISTILLRSFPTRNTAIST